MRKKYLLTALVILSILVVAVFLIYFPKEKSPNQIGGETDSHGCLIAAGYSWNETKQKCVREWEERIKVYCTPESKNATICPTLFDPVCGYFNETIKCLKYPCAQTYPNYCNACVDSKVEYYISGECPEN